MSKYIAIMVLCLSFSITAYAKDRKKEPTYKGKKLGEWIYILENKINPLIKSEAAEATGKIGDASTVPILINNLYSESEYAVRKSISKALVRIGKPAIPELISALKKAKRDEFFDVYSRTGAFSSCLESVLSKIGKPAIPQLIKALEETIKETAVDTTEKKIEEGFEFDDNKKNSDNDKGYNFRVSVAKILGQIKDKAATQALINLLQDKKDFVRKTAAEELGKIGDKRALSHIHNALKKEEDKVTIIQLFFASSKLGDKSNINILTKLLDDKDEFVRSASLDAFIEIGDKATVIPAIIKALKDESYFVRNTALLNIKLVKKHKEVVPLIIKTMKNEKNYFRPWATHALYEVEGNAAIPVILQILENDKTQDIPWEKAMFANYIGRNSKKSIIPILKDWLAKEQSEQVKVQLNYVLAKKGDRAALNSLINQFHNREVSRSVLYALCEIKKMSKPNVLIWLYKDKQFKKSNSKSDILYELGECNEKRGLPILVEALQDQSNEIRKIAIEALGKIGDESAVPALISIYDKDKVRVNRALAEIGGEKATLALISAMKDPSKNIRSRAQELLTCRPDQSLIPMLIKLNALKDKNEDFRKMVVSTMRYFADKRAIPALLDALKDDNDEFRLDVTLTILDIHDSRAIPALINALENDKSPKVRQYAVKALGEFGDNTLLPSFIKALKDEDGNVRWNAAYAMLYTGDRSAVPYLITLLKDEEPYNRVAAAEILALFSDPTAIPALIEALKDTDKTMIFQRDLLSFGGGNKPIPPIGMRVEAEVAGSAAQALCKITGQDFGKDAAKWRAWWDANKDRLMKEAPKKGNSK